MAQNALPPKYTHKQIDQEWIPRNERVVLELINFQYEHLQKPNIPKELAETSKRIADVAFHMADTLPENHELVCGLRDLLRAKDCFVRAVVSVPGVR